MQAMVIPQFGAANIFERRKVDQPRPAAGEILVRVIASGTNPVDAKIRQNGTWAGINPPAILGYDAAGVVEQVGDGVSNFRKGDAVYYTPEIFNNQSGTYAEYNVVSASIVAKKPQGLSFEEAAAVPLAGGTAWEAVVRRMRLTAGETILIHGGAGGVGSFAIQIAKATGAYILATAGPDNQETLRELGADVAIDYRSQNASEIALQETAGRGVDAVFDTVGGDVLIQSLPALRPFGRASTILSVQGNLKLAYLRNHTLHGVFLTRERARLEELTPLLERKQIRPLVEEVLPLEEVGKAHERLDTGHGRGKIILQVAAL